MKVGRIVLAVRLTFAALPIGIAFLFVFIGEHTDAHKAVTSKYDYNKDIFPLLRDHCGRCHVAGGAGTTSLMTYSDAVPWAESIRAELTAGRMPPWPIDATSPAVRGGYPITASDIDKIVTWAAGGTPQGDLGTKLPMVAFNPQWKLGPPDLKVAMEAEHTVAAGTIEEIREFSLPIDLTGTRWVKAADLMPGTASIVRDATISVENGPVLALWQPGGDTTVAPSGAAFRVAPGAKIRLQIRYKKHFDQEWMAVSDKSAVGLYFTDPPLSGRELQSIVIDGPKGGTEANAPSTLTGVLSEAARVVALRPMLDRAYLSVEADAVTPSGTHVPLLRLQEPRPQWFRRYWLQEPVELPRGSQITVRIKPLSDYSEEPNVTKRFDLHVVLDYVPQ